MADDDTLKMLIDRIDESAILTQNAINDVKADVGEVKADVGNLRTEVLRLGADIARVDGSVESLRADNHALRMEMRAGFDRVGKRLDNHENRVKALEARG